MSQEVWIVTSGSYSDYGIEAVFDNAEAAEAMAGSLGDGSADRWTVGSTYDASRVAWTAYDYGEDHGVIVLRVGDGEPLEESAINAPQQIEGHDGEPCGWQVIVRAHNQEHALKIAAEQIAMAKAQLAGIG